MSVKTRTLTLTPTLRLLLRLRSRNCESFADHNMHFISLGYTCDLSNCDITGKKARLLIYNHSLQVGFLSWDDIWGVSIWFYSSIPGLDVCINMRRNIFGMICVRPAQVFLEATQCQRQRWWWCPPWFSLYFAFACTPSDRPGTGRKREERKRQPPAASPFSWGQVNMNFPDVLSVSEARILFRWPYQRSAHSSFGP